MIYSTSKENITQRPFSPVFSLYRRFRDSESRYSLPKRKVPGRCPVIHQMEHSCYWPQVPKHSAASARIAGNHPIANVSIRKPFIRTLATRKIQPITKDFNPTVSPLQWNRGDGCIYFNTDDGDCKNIYRYSPEKRKTSRNWTWKKTLSVLSAYQNIIRLLPPISVSRIQCSGAAYLYV